MQMEFRSRNNDLGIIIPSTQERANTEVQEDGSVALARVQRRGPITPHMPNSQEVEETLTEMEHEAEQQNVQLLRMHALDKARVSRLLSLLR